MQDLINIVAKLRSPEGCPWDRKQTHQSLIPYLAEEAYEVIEEIENDNLGQDFKEELGDLLLQVVLHAQIASEEKRFSIQDVINSISEKMVRRHPHVFNPDWDDVSEEKLGQQWEQIKSKEKKENTKKSKSSLDGIPLSMSALMVASRMGEKAAQLGFEFPNSSQVIDKIEEEIKEVRTELENNQLEKLEGEIGDLLFAVTNLARFYNIQPERALKKTNAKFKQRFNFVEKAIREAEEKGNTLSLEEMEIHWEKAKKELAKE